MLVTIYRKLWSLSSPDLFRPWAFRIASRTAFRYLKKEQALARSLARRRGAPDEIAAPHLASIAGEVDRTASG